MRLSKQEVPNLIAHFPLKHYDIFYQLNYLLSEQQMVMKHKHTMTQLARTIMRSWLRGQSAPLLQEVEAAIKKHIADLCMGMQMRFAPENISSYERKISECLTVPLSLHFL